MDDLDTVTDYRLMFDQNQAPVALMMMIMMMVMIFFDPEALKKGLKLKIQNSILLKISLNLIISPLHLFYLPQQQQQAVEVRDEKA